MMDLLKSRFLSFLFLPLLFGMFISCADTFTESKYAGAALGTTYSILVYDSSATNLQAEIDSVFLVINNSMSTYIPNSDISKINNGDTTVVVDAMFVEVFNLSKDIHKSTQGYFDPTVGILVNSWGFGPGKQLQMDSVVVDSLLEFVGFDKVELREDKTIRKSSPNVLFDFNAIAKGYAVDRLGALLDRKGITNYLVEVGGELIAKGENKEKNKKFVVGIDDPMANDRNYPAALIYLHNKGLASSGNYRHFREDAETGKRYVHTVDPITGYTKDSNILGVTVLADNCTEADGYATAFMAMDFEDSVALLEKKPTIEAFIIYIDQEGVIQEFITEGFDKVLIKD